MTWVLNENNLGIVLQTSFSVQHRRLRFLFSLISVASFNIDHDATFIIQNNIFIKLLLKCLTTRLKSSCFQAMHFKVKIQIMNQVSFKNICCEQQSHHSFRADNVGLYS